MERHVQGGIPIEEESLPSSSSYIITNYASEQVTHCKNTLQMTGGKGVQSTNEMTSAGYQFSQNNSARSHTEHNLSNHSRSNNPLDVQSDVGKLNTDSVTMDSSQSETQGLQKVTSQPEKTARKKLTLTPDLKAAHRIVMQIMSDRANYAFMDEVDVQALKLWDYHDRVKKPMWLGKIEDTFEEEGYTTITEVIRDLRLMLENCYRYNGLDHFISKQAMKIEQVLETKLCLLPRLLQVQSTLYVTSNGKFGEPPISASTSLTGRKRTRGRFNSGGATTPLSNCIHTEFLFAQADEKKRLQHERQEVLLNYRRELDEWEKELLEEPKQQHLNAMWEIPAIGQFLLLFQESLALNEISFYELERCFLIPRASKLLAQIFTCLLSSPTQRKREISKNMGMAMPYKVWQRKLNEKVQRWYQAVDKLQDTQWAASDLGIDVHFFEVMGDKFPLNDYKYHELTFYQRVILMKAIVDNCLEMQPSLRQCLEMHHNADQRAILLGEDASGNSYVHFPQFCGYDLRIYKQAPFPEPELRYIDVDEPDEPVLAETDDNDRVFNNGNRKRKLDEGEVENEIVEARKRPSYLRQNLTPISKNLNCGKIRRSSRSSECNDASAIHTSNHVTQLPDTLNMNMKPDTNDPGASVNGDIDKKKEVTIGSLKADNGYISENDVDEKESTNAENTKELSSNSMHTLDVCKPNIEQNLNNSNSTQLPLFYSEDQLKNNIANLIPITQDAQTINGHIQIVNNGIDSTKMLGHSQSDGKMTDLKGGRKIESLLNNLKNKDGFNVDECELNTNDKTKEERDIEVKSSEQPDESSKEIVDGITSKVEEQSVKPKVVLPAVDPDVTSFELVCDNMQSLRDLVEAFAERQPVEVIKGRRKTIIKPTPRTTSEVELHETLTRLLMELTPHESKLSNAAVRIKERLRKEFDSAQNNEEESDDWDSESSSSSSSSSSSDSDTSDSDDDDNDDDNHSEDEYQDEQEDEESNKQIDQLPGIVTRARRISKKKILLEARKRAKKKKVPTATLR